MKTDIEILNRINSLDDVLGFESSILYRRLPADLRKTIKEFQFIPDQEQLPRDRDSLVIELKDFAYDIGRLYTTDCGTWLIEKKLLALLNSLVWLMDDGFYLQLSGIREKQQKFLQTYKHYGLIE